jgi:hypothetical protein
MARILKELVDKILDFNDWGISIVAADARELWHRDAEVFKLLKGGSTEVLAHRLYELEAQKRESNHVAETTNDGKPARACR